jgi:hypothetical protein
MLSFFWIHTGGLNPSSDFWEQIPDSVKVHKLCGGPNKAAYKCINQVKYEFQLDEICVCLIHISDLIDRKQDMATLGAATNNQACAFFTKGGERQLSTPPYLFGLEEHVLPNLDGLLELLKREASADEFRALFDRWAHPEKTSTQRLMDLLPLDILVQGALILLTDNESDAAREPQRQKTLSIIRERPWEWFEECLPCITAEIVDANGKLTPQLAALVPGGADTPGLAAVIRILRKIADDSACALTVEERMWLHTPDILTACHEQYLATLTKVRT